MLIFLLENYFCIAIGCHPVYHFKRPSHLLWSKTQYELGRWIVKKNMNTVNQVELCLTMQYQWDIKKWGDTRSEEPKDCYGPVGYTIMLQSSILATMPQKFLLIR